MLEPGHVRTLEGCRCTIAGYRADSLELPDASVGEVVRVRKRSSDLRAVRVLQDVFNLHVLLIGSRVVRQCAGYLAEPVSFIDELFALDRVLRRLLFLLRAGIGTRVALVGTDLVASAAGPDCDQDNNDDRDDADYLALALFLLPFLHDDPLCRNRSLARIAEESTRGGGCLQYPNRHGATVT